MQHSGGAPGAQCHRSASNNCLKLVWLYEISVCVVADLKTRGHAMLEKTSRFVLELLPYLIMATCAVILIPQFLGF
jgi:hypothetical protein